MTAGASTRRHFLKVGKAAQRSALGTRATHCLPNAHCPMPNSQFLKLNVLHYTLHQIRAEPKLFEKIIEVTVKFS
ncbi:hypothetical protein [Tolypothrix sp. VBCCA 56010]|uniref:hypothetical protein n=1 Tax=Tolypothrix sp. VBCCA 56010 TaxID=3137731 RepID=UPI003D7CA1C6